MKKNGFLEGAMISTIAIVLCKIIGLVYVIPFYSIIGTQGGALYSYAYSIYGVFLNLATSGIPIAISKIISEYNTLGYNYIKNKAYKIGTAIIISLGFLSFLVLFIFAPQIAYLILGDIDGGNSIESVSMVIRVISTALLIVPILSVKRGYLQGHKYMVVPNLANVIEQLVRVIVIVLGSFMALRVFNLSLDTAVGIAVFGATFGAIIAYFFVEYKIRKNKEMLKDDAKPTREEAKYTNKIIFKKIVFYALPFIVIDLLKSAYNMVDVFTVVKTLVKLGYSTVDAENIIATITTWASKLNMIIISIVMGITTSLVPNIMGSFIKKDFKDVSHKLNQALQVLIILTIPMTIGLSFLAHPSWVLFYGVDQLGINIFKIYIFTALTLSFFSILIDATQTMNNTRVSITALIGAFVIKCILNIPMMYICKWIGIEAYYGPMIATFISQTLTVIYLLVKLKKNYQIDYKDTINTLIKTLLCVGIMLAVLLIMSLFIKVNLNSRMLSLLVCILYAVIGIIVYGLCAFKCGLITNILGEERVNKILKR